MTRGERMVNADFNPSGLEMVADIKKRAADLIDTIDSIPGREKRLAAIAITHIETASMFAVKCAVESGK